MYECPSCGGALRFDIPSQSLKCDHCGHAQDPHTYVKDKDAEERNEYNVTVFTCPQCGGEIMSTDDSATGFCSYCGASTILDSRIENQKRPSFIIPFKQTKEDCKRAYTHMMAKAFFSPKELRDPKYLERFRGIYVPYWVYVVTQDRKDGSFPASRSYRRGDYMITDHYSVHYDVKADYRGMNYDASSTFDDHLSEAIAPFDSHEIQMFSPSFLCGFYADLPDVPATLYEGSATHFANEETADRLSGDAALNGLSASVPVTNTAYDTKVTRRDNAMFPVWFLSYRRRDRVAYAVVNGETGKIAADLPVDIKRYMVGSLLLTIPLFLVLNMMLTITSRAVLLVSSFLALITGIIYLITLSELRGRDRHSDDIGYQYRYGTKEEKDAAKKKKNHGTAKEAKHSFTFLNLLGWIVLIIAASEFVLGFIGFMFEFLSGSLLPILMLVAIIIMAVIAFRWNKDYQGRNIFAEFIGLVAAVIVDVMITLLHPVSDLFYYAGAMASFICICIPIVGLIDKYNMLATRPLPQINRKGGDDRA